MRLETLTGGYCSALIALWLGVAAICASDALAQQSPPRAQTALAAPLRCAEPIARIASLQGLVDLRALGGSWQRARLNDALCLNDSIRVGPNSRASVQYTSDITVQFDHNTFVTLVEPRDKTSIWTQLWRGALHFITRSRRPFRVITPFANASVEGTEVYIALAKERADLTVFEGKLDVANDAGQVLLSSGESASVQGLEAIPDDDQFRTLKAQAPQRVLIAKPRDAVQWALYYPPVIDVRPGANVHPNLKAAGEQFRAGKTAEAFAELDRVPVDSWDAQYFIYRASLLLYVGREQEAQAELVQALQKDDARKSDALALQTIIAIVQNDKERGLSLAQQAVQADPSSAAAQIALSYAQQAIFKLEPALQSAEQAAKLEPNNALAYARIAELQLSQGDLDKALAAAKKAAELNPNLARTQSILGFSYLTRIDTKNAKETFQKAIELDSADPLPHLGLGLAKIREGKLEEGRQDIEQAVILDPNNSLIRSYVGKAYYEEKRDELAGVQFEIAKQLDPNDPTPYFYDAIRKQAENRSVEALSDLQQSIERNENRAPYRSKLSLDRDLGSRGSDLANIYWRVGFNQTALIQGHQSIATDPSNHAAHQFLADNYTQLPRHEIARVSELLQAQLLQPASRTPVVPKLIDDNAQSEIPQVGVLRGLNLLARGSNEYSQLFTSDGHALQSGIVVAEKKTIGDELAISGLKQGFSYRLGQFHFESNGFESDAGLNAEQFSAFGQKDFDDRMSMQAELKRSRLERNVVVDAIDPVFADFVEQREEADTVRLGGRYKAANGALVILSATYQDKDSRSLFPLSSGNSVTSSARAETVEVQSVLPLRAATLVAGASHFDEKRNTRTLGPFDDFSAEIHAFHSTLYGYTTLPLAQRQLKLQLGVTGDRLAQGDARTEKWSPKLGLLWNPDPSLSLRAAAFQTLKRRLTGNQTLEPTAIAGFNQFFDDINGTVAKRVGVGVDKQLTRSMFAGIELTKRELQVPLGSRDHDWKETAHRAYLYHLVPSLPSLGTGVSLALSVSYERETFDRPREFTGFERIVRLRDDLVPIGVSAFLGNTVTIRLQATRVKQEGRFLVTPFVPNEIRVNESVWITDANLAFRLPRRFGSITLGVKNLFDKRLEFQEVDALNPRFAPTRYAYAVANLTF